jgi:hypothetical protein
MLTVKCAKCRSKVFKYSKVGKGRLLHCWPDRIVKDYSLREGSEVRCRCGNLIGIDEGRWIKLKSKSFIRSGTVGN